ncbi:MAG: hypothetical protein ACJ72A_23250 [Nocardioidaceae bacterium]
MTRSASTIADVPAGTVSLDPTPGDRGVVRRRAWAYGALAAVALYSVLVAGWVPGPVAVALGAALVLAVPTASSCARRVALNCAVLVGWSQVLWWVDWPVPVNHGALIAASVAGYLVVVVTGASSPRQRAVDLLPRFRSVDALLVGSVVATIAAMWRWVTVSSPQRALEVLLPGADNYAHFHMFSTLRAYGATTTSLAAPDGSGWGFDEYPQGFHALVATVSELVRPGLTPGPDALVAYVHAVVLVVALGLVMMTAATVALLRLRNRPLFAVPAVVLMWTAFLWEPGQNLLGDGFANFSMAAAAGASALLVALGRDRQLRVVDVAAVGGLLLFVAYAWAPLTVIVAPAVLALAVPTQRARRHPRPAVVAGLAVASISALGILRAFVQLVTQIDVSTVVTALGGLHGSSPVPTFVLILVGLSVCATYPRWGVPAGADEDDVLTARRVRLLVLSPLIGLVCSVVLFAAQLSSLGTTSYYFLKFFMGFELILAAFVPAVVALSLAGRAGTSATRRSRGIVASVVATVLASQAFGHFPSDDAALLSSDYEGTASMHAPYSAERVAHGILAAVRATSLEQALHREYVAIGPDRAAEAFYPDGWFHGTLPSLTRDVQERVDVLRHRVATVPEAAPLVRRLLVAHDDLEVVVDPQYAPALRARLGSDDLAARVVTWRPVSAPVR